MPWIESLFTQTYIDPIQIFLRLLLSLILGGCIGWERESRRQPAGLRTHILICLGATLLMITSIYIPQTFKNFQNGDPGRIAAQVVSGIGFLGAGAIFRLGVNVKGLTTAATIWVVAAVGLSVGAGVYAGALLGTMFILFVLTTLNKVEKKYFPASHYKVLQLNFGSNKIETESLFIILEKYEIKVVSTNMQHSKDKKKTRIKLIVSLPQKTELKRLYKELNGIDNITQIRLG
ncbi:MgtC/SapB family protein [Rhodocytophaga rosea]|uniref:MgtC/SapB family protein n=1 Tax=Rhodocytophaga rosea TaxID=2704465 RepID=A0A6C0GQC5_9BACT|nr:MgtC/SapB family protein [Rhodocytophaga rosea]QHT70278.1 MgtC/SapB family protein [Rhodocytophaga rosea]